MEAASPGTLAYPVVSRALPESKLHVFLRRRRKGSGLVQLPPLGNWLSETLNIASKLIPSEAGSLLLDNPTVPKPNSPLTFVAAFGAASDQLVGLMVPTGYGIAGHVYQTGESYATGLPSRDPKFLSQFDEIVSFRTRSIVAVPVRLERTVCGVFELVNRKGRKHFSPRDVALAEFLAQYVSRAILNAVDVLKQNELAMRDDLTGVYNLRALHPYLRKSIRRAERSGKNLALLFVDVDHLKAINDRYGHRAGSAALERTGRSLQHVVEGIGEIFRFGGDEFIVVCPNASLDEGIQIANRLRDEVYKRTAGPIKDGGDLPPVSISIGVATLRDSLPPKTSKHDDPSVGLLSAADRALYKAKAGGRSRTHAARIKS